MGIERRRHERVDLPEVLHGSVDLRKEGQVINLSASGVMIEHAERLSPGATCVLFLRLLGADLCLRAQIVWSRVHTIQSTPHGEGAIRYRSGLHFPDLPEAAEARIRQYLASLMVSTADPIEGRQ